ncbi:MAG: hypothetical protein ABIQ31_12250 [Ferruginibacter sp.]
MINRLLFVILSIVGLNATAQKTIIDKKKFFQDDQMIEMTIVADFKNLIADKLKKDYKKNFQPATITCLFPDSTLITQEVEINARGEFRREKCDMPPIIVNFRTGNAAAMSKLGRLKLVWPCVNSPYDEQLILKEFIGYKIYNLLTEKSFRVRLVRIQCNDMRAKIKPFTVFAFFIEDVDDMAKRSKCVEIQTGIYQTEQTDREQTTLVALFEYMIGNTDWSVPNRQNVKLMGSKKDTLGHMFVVPYDFDYSGLVNARYAVPVADFGQTTIRQRMYRGFPRTLKELQASLQIFRDQRPAIDSLINNFKQLTPANKKDISKYLGEFFETIKRDGNIRFNFIEKARTD